MLRQDIIAIHQSIFEIITLNLFLSKWRCAIECRDEGTDNKHIQENILANAYSLWAPGHYAEKQFRRKRALWSALYSARENSIGVITDTRHMNNCRINEISNKLKQ
jgi:hypothetical protein